MMSYLRTSLLLFCGLLLSAGLVHAASYSTTPDTVYFTPSSGQTSLNGYVRIQYLGDTTMPGVHIHASITSGSSYFSTSHDTIFTKSSYYWTVTYHVQSSEVVGSITFSNDTTTKTVVLIGHAAADAALTGIGPYYSNVPKGGTSCQYLRLINSGADNDTVTSIGWTHSNGGMFVYDTSISLPHVIHSGDTLLWNVCYHAASDTNIYIDTLVVHYNDAYEHNRTVSRLVYAKATDTTASDGAITASGPYYSHVPKNSTSCQNMQLINTGADVDTITSIAWAHSTGGIFTWDSTVSLPHILHAHDTLMWSVCFHAPNDTNVYIDTLLLHYNDAHEQNRIVSRIVYSRAYDTTSPDGEMTSYGPYFTASTPEGGTNCQNLRLINTGADVDTIVSVSWSHNPNGVFTYDTSVSLPHVLHTHDTLLWSFCFHAPSDTLAHYDTLTVHYHDASSSTRYITRIIYGKATDTTIRDCYSLYAASIPFTEVGDTSRFRLYIANRLDSSVSLASVHFSGSADASFAVDSSTLPHSIGGHQYDSLWVYFIPHASTSSTYSATLTATFNRHDSVHCHSASVSLTGYSAQSARDTDAVSLGDTTTKRVPMVSDSSSYYWSHRIDLVNNTGARIRIDTCYLTSTTHFYIAQNIKAHFPDTLVDGAKHSCIIHFYGDSTHTIYHDTLVATMENALTSFYVFLDGYSYGAKAGVAIMTPSNMCDLRIYPNPTTSIANIQPIGMVNVHYDVLDVLGHVVALHEGNGTWQWNAVSDANLGSGRYYIRAAGKDANGNDVVVTRAIVINR